MLTRLAMGTVAKPTHSKIAARSEKFWAVASWVLDKCGVEVFSIHKVGNHSIDLHGSPGPCFGQVRQSILAEMAASAHIDAPC